MVKENLKYKYKKECKITVKLLNIGFWEPCALYAMKNLDFVSVILWAFPEQAVIMISVIYHRCQAIHEIFMKIY